VAGRRDVAPAIGWAHEEQRADEAQRHEYGVRRVRDPGPGAARADGAVERDPRRREEPGPDHVDVAIGDDRLGRIAELEIRERVRGEEEQGLEQEERREGELGGRRASAERRSTE